MPFYTVSLWQGDKCEKKEKELTKYSHCYVRKRNLRIQSSYLTGNVTIKGEEHELKYNEKFILSVHRKISECPYIDQLSS